MNPKLKKIADRLTAKKIPLYEIYLEESANLAVEVREGSPHSLDRGLLLGYGLRILKGNQIGFAYSTLFERADIDAVINRASESAAYSTPDDGHSFPPILAKYPPVDNWDPRLQKISIEEKIDLARSLESDALAHDSRIKRVRYAAFSEVAQKIFLFRPDGGELFHQKTHCCLTLMAVAEAGSLSEMAEDSLESPFWQDLKPRDFARSVATEAVERLGGVRIPNYRGAVLLSAQVALDMLSILAPSALMENIYKKNSFLIGKKGKKIYADAITLVDDGLNPRAQASSPFDAEGSPRQVTPVIKEGVVLGFLCDRYWGLKEGTASTGNAGRASALSRPRLDISTLCLKPGRDSFGELLKKMDSGILVTQVIGMHTADPISGDFSVGIQGFVIKDGIKKQPLRSVALSGNLHTLFSQVAAVGSDLKFEGETASPSLLISEASISGE